MFEIISPQREIPIRANGFSEKGPSRFSRGRSPGKESILGPAKAPRPFRFPPPKCLKIGTANQEAKSTDFMDMSFFSAIASEEMITKQWRQRHAAYSACPKNVFPPLTPMEGIIQPFAFPLARIGAPTKPHPLGTFNKSAG